MVTAVVVGAGSITPQRVRIGATARVVLHGCNKFGVQSRVSVFVGCRRGREGGCRSGCSASSRCTGTGSSSTSAGHASAACSRSSCCTEDTRSRSNAWSKRCGPMANHRRPRSIRRARTSRDFARCWLTERSRRSEPGTRSTTESVDIDIDRFDSLIAAAESAVPDRAVALYDEALGLWRGDPFGELTCEWWALPESSRLQVMRTSAELGRAAGQIALGHHHRAIADLERLTREHPHDERAVTLLMNALRQTGRSAEALRVGRSFRQRLAEDTGLGSFAGLSALETAVVAGADPAIRRGAPAARLHDPPRDRRGCARPCVRRHPTRHRSTGGDQGDPPRHRRFEPVHRPLRGRGASRRPVGASAHRAAVRLLARARWCVSGVQVAVRWHREGISGQWWPVVVAPCVAPRRGGRRRADRSACRRGGASRRDHVERVPRRGRRGLPRGLRDRDPRRPVRATAPPTWVATSETSGVCCGSC